MASWHRSLAAATVLVAGCDSPIEPAPPVETLVLTNVTVIDGRGGPARAGMTVVLDGGHIVSLDSILSLDIPPSARQIDGTGKFLVPGLWDMHVHTAWDRRFTIPLLIANGVTGAREMFGKDVRKVLGVRAEIAAGHLAGPRIVTAGPIIDGSSPAWPGSMVVGSPQDAARTVDRVAGLGADFVKVYSSLSPEAYFAVARHARRRGIPFAGHLPRGVSLVEASDSGQASIEHLPGASELLSRDSASIDAVVAVLRRNRTRQVPTLTVLHVGARPSDTGLTKRRELRYVPHLLMGLWRVVGGFASRDTTSAAAVRREQELAAQVALAGRMYRAGVPILAGSDTPNAFTVPGFSLHDELAFLVEAGLTPMAALQTATLEPARFLGLADSLGTIEPGKMADLVLLEADPLQDIHNTRRINAVIHGGRFLSRTDLDHLLDRVADGRWRPSAAGTILAGAIAARIPWFIWAAAALLLLAAVAAAIRLRRWWKSRTGRRRDRV